MPVVDGSPARRGLTPPGGPSTFDLFSWSEGPDASDMHTPARISATESKTFTHGGEESSNNGPVGRPTIRMHQPAGGVSTIAFGEHLSPEEAEALLKRRPGSDTKRREMSGNAIFGSEQPSDGLDSVNGSSTPERPSVRVHQVEGSSTAAKPISINANVGRHMVWALSRPTKSLWVTRFKMVSGLSSGGRRGPDAKRSTPLSFASLHLLSTLSSCREP
ncbi:hypothetical protein GOP47_0018855 [Adiantum capillus-veneris]|uniref:DUF4057 domain-containing protein n=1 Tax=Adiantum capillus-veneris TaxID=13818 RepID=A0A9D4UE14_ADICA|nr:hypothetical protein GOP47_0018855 [Adiantum capillus-veneris]